MFRIARRLIFYGGIGFLAGLGLGYQLGNISAGLSRPSSQLERIADDLVITNPDNNRRYVVDFDRLRLERYNSLPRVSSDYDSQSQDDLRILFE